MWRKIIVAWLLGQQSLEKIQNGGRRFTLDWLECFGWRPGHSNFIGSLHFLVLLKIKLFSNAGYAAKLHKECLEILLLLYNLHILTPDHKLVFVFLEQLLSNFRYKKKLLIVFWETSWEITGNCLENLEQLVESPTHTCMAYIREYPRGCC